MRGIGEILILAQAMGRVARTHEGFGRGGLGLSFDILAAAGIQFQTGATGTKTHRILLQKGLRAVCPHFHQNTSPQRAEKSPPEREADGRVVLMDFQRNVPSIMQIPCQI